MGGTLGWVFYAVLCVVVWPTMLFIMYRVAITVLSAPLHESDSRGRALVRSPKPSDE